MKIAPRRRLPDGFPVRSREEHPVLYGNCAIVGRIRIDQGLLAAWTWLVPRQLRYLMRRDSDVRSRGKKTKTACRWVFGDFKPDKASIE